MLRSLFKQLLSELFSYPQQPLVYSKYKHPVRTYSPMSHNEYNAKRDVMLAMINNNMPLDAVVDYANRSGLN